MSDTFQDGVCFLFGKDATGKKKTTTARVGNDARNGTIVDLSDEIARLLVES